MQRIGVFGGSFDPVHIGHLAAAECVRESEHLDQVLFVPNWWQPLKEVGPSATAWQRLSMLRLAVQGNPSFAISDVELRQKKPAFTVETLDTLRQRFDGDSLCFMLGSDALARLPEWRDPARLLTEYSPIVMVRAGSGEPNLALLDRIDPNARNNVRVIDVPGLEVTSSDIRNRVRTGRSIRYLVPESVRRSIVQHGMYQLDGSSARE